MKPLVVKCDSVKFLLEEGQKVALLTTYRIDRARPDPEKFGALMDQLEWWATEGGPPDPRLAPRPEDYLPAPVLVRRTGGAVVGVADRYETWELSTGSTWFELRMSDPAEGVADLPGQELVLYGGGANGPGARPPHPPSPA